MAIQYTPHCCMSGSSGTRPSTAFHSVQRSSMQATLMYIHDKGKSMSQLCV